MLKSHPNTREETTTAWLPLFKFTLSHDPYRRAQLHTLETVYRNVLVEDVVQFGHGQLVPTSLV